jgi:hypothetical protein
MKKITVILAFIAFSFSASAQDVMPKNAIKINPLSLFALTGNVSYERAISHNKSVQIGAFYSGLNFSGFKYAGTGITPEMRFYFAGKKEALNGVYAAPFLRYQKFNIEDKEDFNKTSYTSVGGGATIGWQKVWNSGFTFDIFAGPSFSKANFKNDNDEDVYDAKIGANGVGFRTGLALGFGF